MSLSPDERQALREGNLAGSLTGLATQLRRMIDGAAFVKDGYVRVRDPDYLITRFEHAAKAIPSLLSDLEAAEAKLDAVTRERDEWRTVAGYEAGDPEEAALVKRVLEAARRTEAAEARASRLTEALAWIATYEPEHVAAAEEKFGLTQQENSDANPQ